MKITKKHKIVLKRFVAEFTLNLHCEIKKRATARNISMAEWVRIAIEERIREEKKYE